MGIKPELLLKRIDKLESEIKLLKRRQELLEDSLASFKDIKAALEGIEDLRKGRVIPLSKIEKEFA